MEVIKRLEVELCKPVELGMVWFGGKDLLVSNDALYLSCNRSMSILPVVDELVMSHPSLSH